jgi:ferric iron reductase protein FhuF
VSQDPADTLRRVTSTIEYLRVSVGQDDTREWIGCAAVVGDPDLLGDLVRSTAADRGTERDDVAMSLFVQGYAFRIASIAVGGWLLDGEVLDVSPGATAIALGRNRPNAVRLDAVRLHDAGDDPLATLHRTLVDEHLALLVANAHAACRVGERLLWSGVGAAFASSFGAFMAPLPDRWSEIRIRIEQLMGRARPELADTGRIAHVGPLWAWERTACCLWYTTTGGDRCEDCSLWTDDERRARYDRVLAGLESDR